MTQSQQISAAPLRRFGRMLAEAALVLVVVVALCASAEACPQCQKALAGSAGGVRGNIVRGYFWSILFMLSMPFALVGGLSTYFYLLVRKARKLALASAGAALPEQISAVAPYSAHVDQASRPLPAY